MPISAQKLDKSLKTSGRATLRKNVPVDLSIIEEVYRDERKDIVNYVRNALGEKANGMHFCFRRNDELISGSAERAGYVPVEINGKKFENKGDILCMIAEGIPQKRHDAAALLSFRNVEAKLEGQDSQYGVRDEDGKVHRPFKTEE